MAFGDRKQSQFDFNVFPIPTDSLVFAAVFYAAMVIGRKLAFQVFAPSQQALKKSRAVNMVLKFDP